MITLPYGFKVPEDSDTGDVIFDALEFDIDRLDGHTHNGTNSAPLTSVSQSISHLNWVAASIGGGLYRQLITMTSPFVYDSAQINFKLSTGEFVYPSVEKASSNTYYVYANDNSLDYTAYYR